MSALLILVTILAGNQLSFLDIACRPVPASTLMPSPVRVLELTVQISSERGTSDSLTRERLRKRKPANTD